MSGIQRKENAPLQSVEAISRREDASGEEIQQAAQEGLRSTVVQLPYAEQIQRSFGRHDISRIQAHIGREATASAEAMNASAYATGDHVVFAGTPDLQTAAHEAAHVIQQRGGIRLANNIGTEGDAYEQHADAVAALVTAGQPAEALLKRFAGGRDEKPQIVQQRAGKPFPERSGDFSKGIESDATAFEKHADHVAFNAVRRPASGASLRPLRANRTPHPFSPAPTEAMIQRRIVTTDGKTQKKIRNQVKATMDHLHDTGQAVGATVTDRAEKSQLLLSQSNQTNFTYTYTDLTNIYDHNTDTGASKNAPAVARTNLTARVSAVNAGIIGLPRLAAKSPTGLGADAKYSDVGGLTLPVEPRLPQWEQTFINWVLELHNAWESLYLEANPLAANLANLAKLDQLKDDALKLAARLDNPFADIENLTPDVDNNIQEVEDLYDLILDMRDEAINVLNIPVGQVVTPVMPVWGATDRGQSGTFMRVVWPIGQLMSTLQGQRTFAAASEPLWLDRIRRRPRDWDNTTTAWIKGHLLNANLGGPAKTYNLIPLHHNINDVHSAAVEEALKRYIRQFNHRYNNPQMSPIDSPNTKVRYEVHVAAPATNNNMLNILRDWEQTSDDLDALEANFTAVHGYDPGSNKPAIDVLKATNVYESIIRKRQDPITNVALQGTAVPARFNPGGISREHLNAATRMIINGTIGRGANATWGQLSQHVRDVEDQWYYEDRYVPPSIDVYLEVNEGGGWMPLLARNPETLHNPLDVFRFSDPIMRR